MTDTSQNRTARRLLRIGATAAAVALVAGCGGSEGVRSSLGITLESPDAFNVYPRRPLQMPTDLTQLPPPNPGAPSPRDPSPRAEAQAALGNAGAPEDAVAQADAPSAGEQALLASAAPTRPTPTSAPSSPRPSAIRSRPTACRASSATSCRLRRAERGRAARAEEPRGGGPDPRRRRRHAERAAAAAGIPQQRMGAGRHLLIPPSAL